jgi:hypothetical protein
MFKNIKIVEKINENKFENYWGENNSGVSKNEYKEAMFLYNSQFSFDEKIEITELPENIKSLVKNDNVIVPSLPIFRYDGHTYCVKEFSVAEVSERLNKGEKFAMYLLKEDLVTIRGINLNYYMEEKKTLPVEYEPMRQNRFLVKFPDEFQLELWYTESIERPKYVKNKWSNMKIVFRDAVGHSSSKALFNLIKFVEKFKIYTEPQQLPLFLFEIQMLDPTGVAVEKWQIAVEEIISIDFGNCDYSSDEIEKPRMIIKPLYCTLTY